MKDTKLKITELRNLFSTELLKIAKTLKKLNSSLPYLSNGEGFNVKAWIDSNGFVKDLSIEFPAFTNFSDYPESVELFKELSNEVNCLIAKL